MQFLEKIARLKAFQLGNQLLTLPLPGFKLYINFLFILKKSEQKNASSLAFTLLRKIRKNVPVVVISVAINIESNPYQ